MCVTDRHDMTLAVTVVLKPKYNQPTKLKALTLSQTRPGFYVSAVQVFWKHYGKKINCLLWAIYPFPTVFSTCLDDFLPFLHICVTDCHDMTLAVKVALNPNTTNQPITGKEKHWKRMESWLLHFPLSQNFIQKWLSSDLLRVDQTLC